jgi:hypothetical protein
MTGSKQVDHWTSGTVCEWSKIAGSPQGSPPAADYVGCEARRRTWSDGETVTEELWDQMGLSHCQHNGLMTVQAKACLRQGHNDQLRRCHQCNETTLTRESRFHISIPPGIEPKSLITGSTRVDHWTSGTVCECSEIAGSPQDVDRYRYTYAYVYIYIHTLTDTWHYLQIYM